MRKTSRPSPSKAPRARRLDAALTAREWRTAGLCCEAQADGVPCPEPDCACERCDRARPSVLAGN